MSIVRLEKYSSRRLVDWLLRIAREEGLINVFNPSFVSFEGREFLAFRAQKYVGEKPFRAFFYCRESGCIDLTDMLSEEGLPQVADPKLLIIRGEIFLTFNTGNTGGEYNDVFLLKVWPVWGRARRCVLADRQVIEKNWAFFVASDGALSAIYQLSPLILIRCVGDAFAGDGEMVFERFHFSESGLKGLSIGSQLAFTGSGVALLACHLKIKILGKRGYLGRLVRFEILKDGGYSVSSGRDVLTHSFLKMIPPLRRHNPNLLWATYFSGVSVSSESVVLSYGINDLEFGFSEVLMRELT